MGSELLELAAKCEAALGPDRELDAAIDCWLKQRTGFVWTGHYYNSDQLPNAGGSEVLMFTASLDCAMTLVPEDHAWGTGFGVDPSDYEQTGWAWCGETEGLILFAATPAIALTCAALRARALTKDNPHA